MTERRPLVRIGGRLKDLPVGDTLPDRTSVNGESGALTLRLNQAAVIVGAFDPTNSAPTATFSNAGRTVTFASHTTARVAATQPAHPGGAVRYFEMTFDSGTNNGDCAVGVVGANTDISHQIGYDGEVHEVGMFQNTGRIYSANVLQMTNGAFSTVGDTVGVAVNATTRQIWFRTNGSDWNGDNLANPLTGVGGITIQGTGAIYPAVCSPAVATFTFDPAATFPGATPWGEYSVDGAVSPTDVALDNPVAGQVLMFNGVAWENADAPSGGGGGGMLYRKQVTFTASQSWTMPATALAAVEYVVCGGGGGGGHCPSSQNATGSGGGGGGGQYLEGKTNLTPGQTYAVVIGAGGTGGKAKGQVPSTAGGDSSISGVITAKGGLGGVSTTSTSSHGAGGASGARGRPDTAPAAQTSGGTGATNLNNVTSYTTFSGLCVGGQGGVGNVGQPPLPPVGAGAGGADGPGGDAYWVGSGGGGAGKNAAPAVFSDGGDGYRGQIDIIYWDTVP